MKKIEDQIKTVRDELTELESTFPEWPNRAMGLDGSRQYRAITKRIVESAKRLEQLVKEGTFSRP